MLDRIIDKGTLKRLRIDPTKNNVTSGSFEIDYIVISNPANSVDLAFIQTAEGYVKYSSAPGGVAEDVQYRYTLTDHLGNTRATFAAGESTYLATMETEYSSLEDQMFNNLTRATHGNPINQTPGGNEVNRVNSSNPVGVGIALPVQPGDQLDLSVWSYYSGGSGYNNLLPLNAFITSAAGAFGGVLGGGGESGLIYDAINDALTSAGLGGTSNSNVPAAYLNYLIFNDNMEYVSGGFVQTSTSGGESLTLNVPTISNSGYIYVYVSNESNRTNYVYFDDLTVVHKHSGVVQEDDYYPFGLRQGKQLAFREDNRNLYNAGSELNSSTGLYETFYRHYDPALGRFNGVDIKAHKYHIATPYHYALNSPVSFNDPWGDEMMGPGSGNHWSDHYRDISMNAAFMDQSVFEEFYGTGGMSDGEKANFAVNSGLARYAGTGLTGLINAERMLGNVGQLTFDAGVFTFEVNGLTYGGYFHTTNGVVTSTSSSQLVQNRDGAWISVGSTILSDFGAAKGHNPTSGRGLFEYLSDHFYSEVEAAVSLGAQVAYNPKIHLGIDASLGDVALWRYDARTGGPQEGTYSTLEHNPELKRRLGGSASFLGVVYNYSEKGSIKSHEIDVNILHVFNARYQTSGTANNLFVGLNIGGRAALVIGIEADARWGFRFENIKLW